MTDRLTDQLAAFRAYPVRSRRQPQVFHQVNGSDYRGFLLGAGRYAKVTTLCGRKIQNPVTHGAYALRELYYLTDEDYVRDYGEGATAYPLCAECMRLALAEAGLIDPFTGDGIRTVRAWWMSGGDGVTQPQPRTSLGR